jgi:predicted metal-binding membrane protein
MHGSAHLARAQANAWYFGAISVLGWTLMTIAMMLPTSAPLLFMFRRLVGARPNWAQLVMLAASGYLIVWAAFGLLAQIGNRLLSQLVAPTGWLASPWISGAAILLIAGMYQFTPLKYACLEKCRTPMSFLVSRWQGGNEPAQALRIGIDHGIFCLGCCWSLMLLMFLVGAGNLGWMLLLGGVMALEKNVPWGRSLTAPIGVLLLLAAVLSAWRGLA